MDTASSDRICFSKRIHIIILFIEGAGPIEQLENSAYLLIVCSIFLFFWLHQGLSEVAQSSPSSRFLPLLNYICYNSDFKVCIYQDYFLEFSSLYYCFQSSKHLIYERIIRIYLVFNLGTSCSVFAANSIILNRF